MRRSTNEILVATRYRVVQTILMGRTGGCIILTVVMQLVGPRIIITMDQAGPQTKVGLA